MLTRRLYVVILCFLSCVLGLIALLANPKGQQQISWLGVIRYDDSIFDERRKLVRQKDWYSINVISVCHGQGSQARCLPTVDGKFHGENLHPDGKSHNFFGAAVVLIAGLAAQSLACGYALAILLLTDRGKVSGIKTEPAVHLGLGVGTIFGLYAAATGTCWTLIQSTVATTGESSAPVAYYPVWIAFIWFAFVFSCAAGALEVKEKFLPRVIGAWIWRQLVKTRDLFRR